jgi:branched-chain amino acid aminotransferase
VFYVLDGELRTPSLESGCLAGITRALLIEWCDVVEVDEPVSVLEWADEIFLASTTRDVQPVVWCDGRELAGPGPVTAAAAATWREREAADLDP